MVETRLIVIDTNVFLELFLGQKKAKDCEVLLNEVSEGKIEAVVTHFTVHAVEAALGSSRLLIAFLRNLESSQGLSIYYTGISEEISIAMLMERMGLNFDDALQYYVAKRLGAETIVSFDKHFDNLDVPRVEPSQVVKRRA
jgi:predicted nucleic acid-binding protein